MIESPNKGYSKFFLGQNDPPILKAHNNTDIILRLPMGKRIKDIRWLSVWCRRFTKALWTKKIIFAVNMSQFRTN
uniref:DM13 domain-containing protein n=1 Tax=Glossina palpalis gambiensis TaxID=67801 RepID=A0A1B0BKY5_9MUSC